MKPVLPLFIFVDACGWEIVKEVSVTLDGLRKWCDFNVDDVQSLDLYNTLKAAEDRRKHQTLREGNSNNG